MDKKVLKKLTFDDIIAKKLQRDNEKNITFDIEVPSMEGSLIFTKPDENVVLKAMNILGEGKDIVKLMEAYDYLIYKSCPTLQNTDLQKQLEITVPTDIVKAVMSIKDRTTIGVKLLETVGANELSEEIKN